MKNILFSTLFFIAVCAPSVQAQPLFDSAEFLDESTLDINVVDDWHVDTVNGTTRQKLVDIRVAEWWPGFDYRVLVRFIVPLDAPATGIHLTGANTPTALQSDRAVSSLEAPLLAGGIGIVQTVVKASLSGGAATEAAMVERLLATLDLRYSQIWIWTMIEMRAITAAFAETAHFLPGKVAISGGSKNCMTPTVASIHDARITAVWGSVCSPWLSPLDLLEEEAVEDVEAANDWFFDALASGSISPGRFTEEWYADKSFGSPTSLQQLALAAGWTWEDLRALTSSTAADLHLSMSYDALVARGNEYFYAPGTHDYVASDLVEGQASNPEIPVYIEANGGHGPGGHPAAEPGATQNTRAVFLRNHFFGTTTPMLETPASSYSLDGNQLSVAVNFENGPEPTSGRIWWAYDRAPGGSGAYIWALIPDDQFADMTFDPADGTWKVTIEVDRSKGTVDFWSNHGQVVDGTQTYISSPYTRVDLTTNIRTTRFKIRDDAVLPIEPKKRKFTFKSSAFRGSPSGVITPAYGSDGDPTPAGASGGGATLTIHQVYGAAENAVTLDLPASRWEQSGSPLVPGYRYNDSKVADGPIQKIRIRNGTLTIAGKGEGLYTLEGAPQGRMALRLQLGNGAAFCATAGAKGPGTANDSTVKFNSDKSAPPAPCPPVNPASYGSATRAFLESPTSLLD